MHDGPVLKMEEITKTFPGVLALDRASLSVNRGEVHVLLGENGAGKSTLMKILTGAYRKDSGRIVLRNAEIEIENPREALDMGISMVYQEANLAPHLDVGENIFLGREPLAAAPIGLIDWKQVYGRTAEILSELHVHIDPKTLVKNLTVAHRQMVEIAKASSAGAEIIILDEPTAPLTEQEIEDLFARIRELKKRGVSFIYISHRLEEIPEIGDRVTVLRDGRTVGTVAAAESIHTMIRMMVGRELKDLFPKVSISIGEERIRVEGLNRKGILHDVSFSARKGEIVGLAGLVCAGRTELARAIFGADPIDAGSISIDGRAVTIRNPKDAIMAGIGYLSEDRKHFSLALPMSVAANITLASLPDFSPNLSIRQKEEESIARDYAQALGIRAPSIHQKVKFLSGGNQQKVVIAKWLCTKARILFFDEPTVGVDVGAKIEIFQLMNRLVERGVTVVMISSYLPEILSMSDRILVMCRGRITKEFKSGEASQEDILYYATIGMEAEVEP